MPRIARIVVPECPHHITQRGGRRQRVFFCDEDKILYIRLLKHHGEKHHISFLCYCLMENHVHLVAVPRFTWSLTRGIGEAHKKYAIMVNTRENWKGHLWQARFSSYPLDEEHLFRSVRYIERNPVKAGIVSRAEDYMWSSARAHVQKKTDPILSDSDLFTGIDDWSSFLKEDLSETETNLLRDHERSGRPLGEESFISQIEEMTGRVLRPRKRGRKKGKGCTVTN